MSNGRCAAHIRGEGLFPLEFGLLKKGLEKGMSFL